MTGGLTYLVEVNHECGQSGGDAVHGVYTSVHSVQQANHSTLRGHKTTNVCHEDNQPHLVVNKYWSKIWVRWLVDCWSFTSLQHLRSYQDGYRLVAVCTSGYFIVLPHRKSSQSHYPDTKLTSPWPIQLMLSILLGSDKYQFLKLLV